MKYYKVSGEVWQDTQMAAEYRASRAIGNLKIGEKHVFFRSGLKIYALAGTDVSRIYRRVLLVPARMCCGKGDLAIENIVFEKNDTVLAQVQMPGERAGKAALEALKEVAPQAEFTCPPKQAEEPV